MRDKQKWLIDYSQIDSFIPIVKLTFGKDSASLLFDCKQNLYLVYGRLAANFSLLLSVFEDNSIKVDIVPHDFQL